MRTEGLSDERAPPLSIPISFFMTAPLALVGGGALVASVGAPALASGFSPVTLLLTHLGTLGFLGAVMFGALYPMAPVLGGAPVPGVRLAHVVHASLVLGLVAVALVLTGVVDLDLHAAFGFVETAALLFLGPVGWAFFRRATVRDETVFGVRVALAALLVAVLLGTVMERALSGDARPGSRALWLQVHMCMALLGWVGGLIAAVSWRLAPAFFLAPEVSRGARRATLAALAVGVALALGALAADADERAAALATAPAAIAIWLVHPVTLYRTLARRERPRPDPALRLLVAGLALGPVTLVAAAAAAFLDDARLPLLFGWLAIFGWAGAIVHGMLGRIVPLLARRLRPTPPGGPREAPSEEGRLPDRWMRQGLVAHLAALALGAAAILTGLDAVARAAGGAVIVTGALLGRTILGARRAASRPARA